MVDNCLIWIVILKAWEEWLCMNGMVYGLYMIGVVWSWHVILYGIVGYQRGIVSVRNTLLYSWSGKDELEWIQYGIWMRIDYKGWHEIYMHEKYYLFDWIWLVCGQYVISWASRWDPMVVLQWSERNSMTPVSGSSWWFPIYIIW